MQSGDAMINFNDGADHELCGRAASNSDILYLNHLIAVRSLRWVAWCRQVDFVGRNNERIIKTNGCFEEFFFPLLLPLYVGVPLLMERIQLNHEMQGSVGILKSFTDTE